MEARLTDFTETTVVSFFNLSKSIRYLFGSRSMVRAFVSLLEDVSNMFSKKRGYASEVILLGVGFRFDPSISSIIFNLGYSHRICMFLDYNTGYRILKQYLVVFGYKRSAVSNVGAIIRGFRIPNAYKAKGIRYLNEFIIQKTGKQKQQK